MANRSYLYALDFTPNERTLSNEDVITGVSECGICNTDFCIPFIFEILMSEKPELCKSLIFDCPFPAAIVADFAKGKEKLFNFFNKLSQLNIYEETVLSAYTEEAKKYLEGLDRKYFLLEPLEIFGLADSDNEIKKDLQRFHRHLQEHESVVSKFLNNLQKEKKDKLQSENELQEIGLGGYWSEHLYFSFKSN